VHVLSVCRSRGRRALVGPTDLALSCEPRRLALRLARPGRRVGRTQRGSTTTGIWRPGIVKMQRLVGRLRGQSSPSSTQCPMLRTQPSKSKAISVRRARVASIPEIAPKFPGPPSLAATGFLLASTNPTAAAREIGIATRMRGRKLITPTRTPAVARTLATPHATPYQFLVFAKDRTANAGTAPALSHATVRNACSSDAIETSTAGRVRPTDMAFSCEAAPVGLQATTARSPQATAPRGRQPGCRFTGSSDAMPSWVASSASAAGPAVGQLVPLRWRCEIPDTPRRSHGGRGHRSRPTASR